MKGFLLVLLIIFVLILVISLATWAFKYYTKPITPETSEPTDGQGFTYPEGELLIPPNPQTVTYELEESLTGELPEEYYDAFTESVTTYKKAPLLFEPVYLKGKEGGVYYVDAQGRKRYLKLHAVYISSNPIEGMHQKLEQSLKLEVARFTIITPEDKVPRANFYIYDNAETWKTADETKNNIFTTKVGAKVILTTI